MELILTQDVEKLGRQGDVVRVRDGYARNYLLPQSFAIAATRANQQFVAEQRERSAKRKEKDKAEAMDRAKKLAQTKLTLEAKAGEEDKLFGSITTEDICEALAKKGHTFDKKQIHLKEAIRSLGNHSVVVDLFSEVKATITLEVIRSS